MGGKTGQVILGGLLIGIALTNPFGWGALAWGSLLQAGMLYAGATLIRAAIVPEMAGSQAQALRNDASTEAPVLVVYGSCVIGARIVDLRTTGSDNLYLWFVGSLCHGSSDGSAINSIDEVWFDERLAFDENGNINTNFVYDAANPASAQPTADLYKHLGAAAQTHDTNLNSNFPTAWPVTSDGAGIAYIVLRLKYFQQIYPTGIPVVWCRVKGVRVYDPRDTTWKYSTNPALCIRDYLLSTIYGCGVEAGEIDEQSFIDAANFCDDVVDFTTESPASYGNRFTCNGWLDTTQEVTENLQKLLSSCRGELVYQSGQFSLTIRHGVSTTGFVFDRSNIVGEWSFRTPNSDEAPNVMKITYVDEDQRHQATTVRWPGPGDSNLYLTEDNGILEEGDIELPMTKNPYMARQIAMVALKERRFAEMATCVATEAALKCRVGDLVEITHDTPGWTLRKAWVTALGLRADGLVDVAFQTYDVNAYTYDPLPVAEATPDTSLPDPFSAPPAPSGLVATTGTLAERIKLEWNAVTTPYVVRYEVEAREDNDPTFRSYAGAVAGPSVLSSLIDGVADGETWHIRVRAVNSIGVQGAWATISHVVSIANVVEYSVAVTPEADAIFYAINWGTDCAYVRVYSIEYDVSGGAVPPESNEYLAGEIIQASGATSIRIATTANAYRVTKTVGYSASGARGPVYIFDDQATAGTGPSNPPTTLAQDTSSLWILRQTTLLFTWANGDATAQTGVWVDGVQRNLFAAGATSGSVDMLTADTPYDVEIAHYKDGVWNPDLSDKVGPVVMSTEPATLDAPVGFDAYGAFCNPGDPYMGFSWAMGANADGAKTRISRSATGAFAGEQDDDFLVTAAGATEASDSEFAPVFCRPDSNIVAFNSGGFADMDEVTPNDADYAALQASVGGPTSDTATVGLSNVTDPVASGGHVLRVRHRLGSPMVTGGYVKAELLQGGALKATLNLNRYQASFSTEQYGLTDAEADAITDYTDLQVRFTISIGPADGTKDWWISWCEFQVPGGTYYFRARHEKQYVTSSAWTSPVNSGVYGDCEA